MPRLERISTNGALAAFIQQSPRIHRALDPSSHSHYMRDSIMFDPKQKGPPFRHKTKNAHELHDILRRELRCAVPGVNL